MIVPVREGVPQTLAYARENVDASIEVGGGKRLYPLVVSTTKSPPLASEVRRYYVDRALASNFLALGLVVEASPLGRMMGNVFFRMMNRVYRGNAKAEIPTRLFGDEASAVAWLAIRQ